MRSKIRVLVSCSLLLAAIGASAAARAQSMPPPVASAQPTGLNSVVERPGVDLGFRLGYALPMGEIITNSNLGDIMSGAIPLVLEAGYRATPNFSAGILFQYAVAQTKNCDPGSSCSASIVRFGLEGIYNLRMGGTFDPWFGLGVGYEQLNLSESGAVSADGDVHGFDFTLHAGGDYRVAPQFALGPFISFSVGQYGTISSGGQSADIPSANTSMHEWLQIGLRGTFSL